MSDDTFNTLLNVMVIAGVIVLIFNYTYGSNTGEEYKISNMTDGNKSPVVPTYTPKITKLSNTSLGQVDISLATEDDRRLIYLMVEGDLTLRSDILKAAKVAENKDYRSFEMSGTIMKNDSRRYLNKINTLNISSPFKILLDEYRQALENFYKAGTYIETGSRDPLSDDIEKSIYHMNNANAHISDAYYIIKLDRSESGRFLSNVNNSNLNTSNTRKNI